MKRYFISTKKKKMRMKLTESKFTLTFRCRVRVRVRATRITLKSKSFDLNKFEWDFAFNSSVNFVIKKIKNFSKIAEFNAFFAIQSKFIFHYTS